RHARHSAERTHRPSLHDRRRALLRRPSGGALCTPRAPDDAGRVAWPRPPWRHPRRRARRRRARGRRRDPPRSRRAEHAVTLDWHTSAFPELRPGPPWVMEEMIRAQAALPDDLSGLQAADQIHDAARRALAAGDEVTVVGCGTSEHGAMAIAALLRDGL